MSPDARRYYDGGHRAVLGGVPVRLARKPTPNMRSLMSKTFTGRKAVLSGLHPAPEQEWFLRKHAWFLRKHARDLKRTY